MQQENACFEPKASFLRRANTQVAPGFPAAVQAIKTRETQHGRRLEP